MKNITYQTRTIPLFQIQYQYQYLRWAQPQYQYQYQYLAPADVQYQYQYQYLEGQIFNTNTNTNTWKFGFSIPIPIPILAKNSIPQYQYQYFALIWLSKIPKLSQNQSNMMKGSNFTAFYVILDTFFMTFGSIIEHEKIPGIVGSIGSSVTFGFWNFFKKKVCLPLCDFNWEISYGTIHHISWR